MRNLIVLMAAIGGFVVGGCAQVRDVLEVLEPVPAVGCEAVSDVAPVEVSPPPPRPEAP